MKVQVHVASMVRTLFLLQRFDISKFHVEVASMVPFVEGDAPAGRSSKSSDIEGDVGYDFGDERRGAVTVER